MPIHFVQDVTDAGLAPFRSVGDPPLARRLGLFVAEGRLVVERLITHRPELVQSVLVSPAAAQALDRLLSPLAVPVYVVAPELMQAVTGFSFHQGCLALATRPEPLPLSPILDAHRLVVVLDGLTNVDNVGSIFRTAAAFGAAVLLSPSCCDPLYRKAIRTSMGAVLTTDFTRLSSWPDALDDVRKTGFAIVGLSPRSSTPLDQFAQPGRRPDRIAVVLGTEGEGLNDRVSQYTDALVSIPMKAGVDSLNVGVAAGIALARLARV